MLCPLPAGQRRANFRLGDDASRSVSTVSFTAEVVGHTSERPDASLQHNETCSLVFVRLTGLRHNRAVVDLRFSCQPR